MRRLWQTATAASVTPEITFARLPRGRVAPALLFALASETLALGSTAIAAGLVLWAGAPAQMAEVLSTPGVPRGLLVSFVSAVALMVALHALWGYSLELTEGASARADRALGVRFGLYACGWDLLTSPIGLVHGLVSRGPASGLASLLAAARAPRRALDAYLGQCRALDDASRRRAQRRSTRAIAAATAVALIGSCLAGWHFVELLGY